MHITEVLTNLCYYDPRNPDALDQSEDDEKDRVAPRRSGCACDNCFYGRDALALEILRLMGEE